MKLLLLFVFIALIAVTARADPSARALAAQERHDAGTDAHGHNKGIPYVELIGYKLNADGTVPYEYQYKRNKHGRPVFNDSAYDVYRHACGCSVSREELVDYVDAFLDLDGNHNFTPKEMPHVLDCLGGVVRTLMKMFTIHPTRMMDTCSVDGVLGVSKSDFLLSANCLPTCDERMAAKKFVFGKLLDGSCRVNATLQHDLLEVFGKDWADEIGGEDKLDETIAMYGLKTTTVEELNRATGR